MTNTPMSKKARMEALLEKGELSDCQFIVEESVIKAHKLILACSSPVFEKMFYGDLASDRVIITDIKKKEFKQMLQFVYTDNVEIESVLNAWSLVYISHKYLLNDLSSICETYVEHNLAVSNLVLNYEYAEMYGISAIQQKCMRDICEYSRGIFWNYDYHMKQSTVVAILKQCTEQTILNEDNNNLIEGVITWAVNECDKSDIEISPGNIVQLLGDTNILEYVRKIDLYIEYFRGDSFTSEVCGMLQNSVKLAESNGVHWLDWYLHCECRQVYKIAGRAELREGDCITSNIIVNKKVLLFGLAIVTEDDKMGSVSSATYNGKILIQIRNLKKFESSHTVCTKRFPFETPVYIALTDLICLEPFETYVIKVFYTNLDNVSDLGVRKSSVLCNYMSNTLQDEKRKIVFTFQELNGGVIKGISYYPA